jgi:hypothetical protein
MSELFEVKLVLENGFSFVKRLQIKGRNQSLMHGFVGKKLQLAS